MKIIVSTHPLMDDTGVCGSGGVLVSIVVDLSDDKCTQDDAFDQNLMAIPTSTTTTVVDMDAPGKTLKIGDM